MNPLPRERLSVAVARRTEDAFLRLTIGAPADLVDFLGEADSLHEKEARTAAMTSGHWLHVDKRRYESPDGLCGTIQNIEDDDSLIHCVNHLIHGAFEPFFTSLKPRLVSEKLFCCEILSNVEPVFRARIQQEVDGILASIESAPIAWETRQMGLT